MTTISFPVSPVVNDTYTYLDRTWIWNGTGWAWYVNRGQVDGSWQHVGSCVDNVNVITEITDDWLNIDYV